MRILLVEDDPDLGPAIERALREEHFVVDLAADGVDACHLGDTELYDAVVLDLGMPGQDGLSVLKTWRDGARYFPVLVLTARDGWSDKVAAFKIGADDFMTKPFRIEELVMRLRALVRRTVGNGAPRLECRGLVFETQTGQFELDGLPLRLTALEWRVLSSLMLRKGVVIDRLELLEHVYDRSADVGSNSMEVIIGRLRKKIGAELIETVRGRGYRLTGS